MSIRDSRALDHVVPFLLKHPVCLQNVVQIRAVGDQAAGVKPALRDQLHDLPTAAAVHSPGFKHKVFAVHLRQRQALVLLVHGDHADHRVGAGDLPGHFKGPFSACGLHHAVRAPAAGKRQNLRLHIALRGV